MNFLKNPTVIIVILGLVFGTSLFLYNNYQSKKKAAEEAAKQTTEEKKTAIVDLTNVDPKDFTTEIKAELDLADKKAKEYNTNEVLSGLEITISGTLIPRSGNATYIYDQPKDTANHYTVSISQGTQAFIRALIPVEDYFGILKPINVKSWRLNYIDALKIAEKNGGQDFRSKNELRELKLTLKHDNPKGWLYWFVRYSADASNFEAQIDAFTGKYQTAEDLKSTTTTTDQTTTP